MTGFRLGTGGRIDRSRVLNFTFDGTRYSGHPGDTLASALIANGVRIMGRSFKYHRPRSVWSAWFDDPNAIFNIRLGDVHRPNCPSATTLLEDGMHARAVNSFPSAARDIKSVLDLGHRFLSAGFYYKMFMWPDWHLFEPTIRKMAGLGALEGGPLEDSHSTQRFDHCDLLVVGGGVAGLQAAATAAEAGQSVVLVDDHAELGGKAWQSPTVNGHPVADWVAEQTKRISAAGGRILTRTTAFGIYDHAMVGLCTEHGFCEQPSLTRMRPEKLIMATGALDRPLTFAQNDLPGVMSLDGAAEFAGRYGVAVGRRACVIADHGLAEQQISTLRDEGLDIDVVEPKDALPKAMGRRAVTGLQVGPHHLTCDTVLTSAGLMPIVHLWRHAGGKLDWDSNAQAFVPAAGPAWITAIGAAAGTFDLDDALAEATAVATGAARPRRKADYCARPRPAVLGTSQRQWIDFQHDVTLKDVELAARENYVSVEHLKRYTTLGMASDQGKTSNVAGLSAMAALQGKEIPEVGTTTFRPPFVPVPLELYRGHHRGELFHPLKRLCLEPQHRAADAALGEYGGWLRPGWYGGSGPNQAAAREVRMARTTAGIFDASPLGKIEVMGPDAENFVNFIYYNTIATLKPGHIRYGFMLTESGVVYDDGVIARMDENRFVISCSSSHVDGVESLLENWRQDGNDPDRVFVHNTTQNWPTITVTGPKARDIVSALDLDIDLSMEHFKHMQFREGRFQGAPVRVARVSFTGDVSFEISCSVAQAAALWDAAIEAGEPISAGPIGLEALSILRAEKGFLIIGKDTDGETMPHDLGFGIPRQKKKVPFVGDRGLHTKKANGPKRRHLVGLAVPENAAKLPCGAHLVTGSGETHRTVGFVTSSYDSPTLNRPIALALLSQDLATEGNAIDVYHMGEKRQAKVVPACQFDPNGERLDA